ncbi:MAG TPA: glycoside hydrolase family 3 N-terminal domain-containing protein [Candidatus Eisenbacteria bacterium]|nr:glycoside hydrolase family 3 N-terminal domain-containing protein [Candidatus Eisenbacteria bacterium]
MILGSLPARALRLLTCPIAVLLLLVGGTQTVAQQTSPYRDLKLPIEQRIDDLLSRMSLQEKIAQLEGAWENRQAHPDPKTSVVDDNGKFLPERAAIYWKEGLGEMSRPSEPVVNRDPRQMAEFTNTVQKWFRENTRLGIPVLFHQECLHGLVAPGATSYPQAIALASTWDPALVRDVFTATAAEARSRGTDRCLAPVLDLARDPRWGRTEETYGEDPYLVTQIGMAAIRGFQGTGPDIDKAHVFATAKHFAVHGQPEGGTNVGPADLSEREVRETYLKPFYYAVTQADVQTVMASYNEVDGIPSHSNKYLLIDVLRHEWGFHGLVASDYFGIMELIRVHHIADSPAVAARMALEAGVDLELPFADAYGTLEDQVKQGLIAESTIDRSVRRVLRQKFQAGLFDDPYVDPAHAAQIADSPEHRQLALKAAHEAITLLKNDNQVLPLDETKYKHIAVIGPNAAEAHLGGYSNDPGKTISILEGIKEKVGKNAEILYSEGCKITETPPDWNADKVVLGDPALNVKRIEEAEKVAKKADLIILALGGNEQTSREAWAVNHPGDRVSLDLLGNQDDLVKVMLATGKPVVVVLLHGRPNSINYIAANVPAILDGWYLGEEGGTAVADVLFGDYNPAGRLPITVPRSVGQLPDYYYQKPSAKREYLDSPTTPLFPFGWGLSYSRFEYSNLHLSADHIGPEGTTKAIVSVKNTSGTPGQEVVQLYIRDEVSSVTRPVEELRGFQRISLAPGETKTVEFLLGPEELSFLNREMKRVVEPGSFDIMAGGNSMDLIHAKLIVDAK